MKVLVCDDSVVYRSQIKRALSHERAIDTVDVAANGKIALSKLAEGNYDLLVLDHEMPEQNGIETLKLIRSSGFKTRVIFFSALSEKGGHLALEALKAGADDVLAKPRVSDVDPLEQLRNDLVSHVLQFCSIQAIPANASQAKSISSPRSYSKVNLASFYPKLVVIASSTGGPPALEKIFKGLSPKLKCPILVVQHMPPVFTACLAKRLSESCGTPVVEARHGEKIEAKIYVAPGDFHMAIDAKQDGFYVRLSKDPPVNSVRPAADVLFASAAEYFGPTCMGYVVTGMGEDGAAGVKQLKEKGAGIMIQNSESCVVFGMPGAVFRDGTYDAIGDLDQINKILRNQVGAA
jgi:two-component system chemotaxis response regulator CheB